MSIHLVPRLSAAEPRIYPIYSRAVRRALTEIRAVRVAEEAKLNPEERLELADALEILAVAALIDSHMMIDAHLVESRGNPES